MADQSTKGRTLHEQAEIAREKEQDFLKALQLIDEATVAYINDKDYLGASEAQASRFITLNYLFDQTSDQAYSLLAMSSAKVAIEMAEASRIKEAIALPYFNLAKAYEDRGEYTQAVPLYQKAWDAITTNPPATHNRPAVRADILAHKSFSEYMAGDKSAIERLKGAIEELKNADEPQYTKDVWLSGAYMRMAKALGRGNPETTTYLDLAKAVIDKNPELKLRLGQWEKLAKELV